MAKTEKSKRLDMLLALAMTKNKYASESLGTEASCPSVEDIACYFDKQLSDDEKQHFLTSLSVCPESYAAWIRMADTLGFAIDEQIAIQPDESLSLAQQLTNWLRSYQGIFASALVASFAVFVVLNLNSEDFSQLPLEKQIATSWQENQSLYLAHMDVSEYLVKKSTKSSLEVLPFAEKIAFSHGFKKALELIRKQQADNLQQVGKTLAGKDIETLIKLLPEQNMACDNTLCEKETLINEQLGSWSALVLHQCQQSNNSKAYWRQQQSIIKTFGHKYQNLNALSRNSKELSAVSLSNRLDNLNPTFKQLPGQIPAACASVKQLALYAVQLREIE